VFGESFFKDLDLMVDKYVQASTEIDYASVIVRTRLGSFSVARACAAEMLVRLRVHPPPRADDGEASDNVETAAGFTQPGEGQLPATEFETLPLVYVPYSEVVIVEIMPMVGERGYVPSNEAVPDPVIGFGR